MLNLTQRLMLWPASCSPASPLDWRSRPTGPCRRRADPSCHCIHHCGRLRCCATIALRSAAHSDSCRAIAKIAQGNLEHRVEWSSRDDLWRRGSRAEPHRRSPARTCAKPRPGRRQMEFQLSDAVLQSIFEPIIVTDGKGHVLKVNPGRGRAAWRRSQRPHGPGQYSRRRQDPQRHSRRDRHAKSCGHRGRRGHAAHAIRQA